MNEDKINMKWKLTLHITCQTYVTLNKHYQNLDKKDFLSNSPYIFMII